MAKRKDIRKYTEKKYENWSECGYCLSFAPFDPVYVTRRSTRRKGAWGVLVNTTKKCRNCNHEKEFRHWEKNNNQLRLPGM